MSDIPGQTVALGYEMGDDPWYEPPTVTEPDEATVIEIDRLSRALANLNRVEEMMQTPEFEWVAEQVLREQESMRSRADKIVEQARWSYFRGGIAACSYFLAFPERVAVMRSQMNERLRALTEDRDA